MTHALDSNHFSGKRSRKPVLPGIRRFSSPKGMMPATNLISNGSYSVMLTAALVTMWLDMTRDSDEVWSTICQRVLGPRR